MMGIDAKNENPNAIRKIAKHTNRDTSGLNSIAPQVSHNSYKLCEPYVIEKMSATTAMVIEKIITNCDRDNSSRVALNKRRIDICFVFSFKQLLITLDARLKTTDFCLLSVVCHLSRWRISYKFFFPVSQPLILGHHIRVISFRNLIANFIRTNIGCLVAVIKKICDCNTS